jgi:hypothetical protein
MPKYGPLDSRMLKAANIRARGRNGYFTIQDVCLYPHEHESICSIEFTSRSPMTRQAPMIINGKNEDLKQLFQAILKRLI